MAPRVSVTVTTYNHARYVEQALDSVLAQDFDDYELIITDDASTDDSARVIQRWLDRTGVDADFQVHERNLGICGTRNRVLARARGELMCGLAADDWHEPARLSRQVAAFDEQSPEVAVVYGDVREVDEAGALVRPSYLGSVLRGSAPPSGMIFNQLRAACFIPAMGAMVRRSAVEAVGGFDETLVFDDWDLWLRLADRYRFHYLGGDVVANRRLLPTSLFHAHSGTVRWHHSIGLMHAKWLHRDPVTQRVAARRIRHAAVKVAVEDRREARRLLAIAGSVPPGNSALWRSVRSALTIPGSGWGLGIAHARWVGPSGDS